MRIQRRVALPLTFALALLPAAATAQPSHSWEFNVMPFAQSVSIEGLPDRTNAGLGVNLGLNFPDNFSRHVIVTSFFGVSADAAAGVGSSDDVAFSSSEIGLQLMTKERVLGTAVVLRAGKGWRNTAESQNGSVLTNHSGGGTLFGLGARPSCFGSHFELSISLIRGSFDNAQEENLDELSHIDEVPVNTPYKVVRFGLSFAF